MLALSDLRRSILCFSLNIKFRSARSEITWYQWTLDHATRAWHYTQRGLLLGTIGLF